MTDVPATFTRYNGPPPVRAPKLGNRLQGAYGVSLSANAQRAGEEARVRAKMAERQQRQQKHVRELLRRQVVQLALEEEQRNARNPRVIAQEMEQRKRLDASLEVAKSDDVYQHLRTDLSRRFIEPCTAAWSDDRIHRDLLEKDAREADFQQRRIEHRLQHRALRAQIQESEEAKAQLLAAYSEAKWLDAKKRYDLRMATISRGTMGGSASAPALSLKEATFPPMGGPR